MKIFKVKNDIGNDISVGLSLTNMVDPELYMAYIKDGQLDIRIGSISARKNALIVATTAGEAQQICTLEDSGELPAKYRDQLLQQSVECLYNTWALTNTIEEN